MECVNDEGAGDEQNQPDENLKNARRDAHKSSSGLKYVWAEVLRGRMKLFGLVFSYGEAGLLRRSLVRARCDLMFARLWSCWQSSSEEKRRANRLNQHGLSPAIQSF